MANEISGIQSTVEIDGTTFDVLECTITDAIDEVPVATVQIAKEAALEPPHAFLGREVVLRVGAIEAFGEARTFRGRVIGAERRLIGTPRPHLKLTVSPDLFRLTKRSDVRTFQKKNVKDIAKEVMDRAGAGKCKFQCTATYEPRDYVVQYRETDFAFLTRILSEEGIAFTFNHVEDETVFFDEPKGLGASAVSTLEYVPEFGFGQSGATVSKVDLASQVRSDKTMLREYDFLRPRFELQADAEGTDDGEKALEVYQFPARSVKDSVVKQFSTVLLEAVQARRHEITGDTSSLVLYAAETFTIQSHPLEEIDVELMATRVVVTYRDNRSMTESNGASVRTSFTAMDPAISRYRPERRPRAVSSAGPQTALTTGAPGEEIDVDEHGRVLIQFPWDRVGTNDDKSSARFRTCQLPTGGSMLLPRVGWEVLVQADEGDVDLPLVMSRLYNQVTMPPYSLPGGSARTALQTATSPGGGSTNEMRMDDTKGSEEMFFNASKDMTVDVKHNFTESVGANATRAIGSNLEEEITNSLTTSIGGSDSEDVGGNEKVAAETLMTSEVTGSYSLDIGGNRDLKVGGDHKHTLEANSSLEVGSMKTDLVVGKVSETVDGNATLDVGAARVALTASTHSTEVAGNHDEKIGALKVVLGWGGVSSETGGSANSTMIGAKIALVDGDRNEEAGATLTHVAAGATIVKADNINFEADTVLSFVMGASTITLTPAAIIIAGVSIKIDGATAETAALIIDN